MNCQNCGAENEPGARFCAECGTPLEDLRGATQPLENDDHTILSTASQLAEEAKTVSVTQDEVAVAADEIETDIPYEDDEPTIFSSEPPGMTPAPASPPPPESPPPAGGSSSDGGFLNQRNIIIIAVVVLLVLCCCCFFIVLGVILGSGDIQQMFPGLNNLGSLAPHRYFG
jgi:hypothetical protein